jgi:hypothetical protein
MAEVAAAVPATAAPPQALPALDGTRNNTTERLKMLLGGGSSAPQPKAASAQPDATDTDSGAVVAGDDETLSADKPVPKPEAKAQGEDQATAAVDEVSDDAQSEERQFSNLTELLEAGGFDLEKGMDLELPVKIDGKEGTAKLRDLLKSYQLDGHINQRLESVNNDRKALDGERQQFQTERADKLLKLDAGVKTLERALLGEFQQVDWNKLVTEDPAAYNAKFVDFQQRNLYLQDIGQQIAQERQQAEVQQRSAYEAHLAEQRRLMQAKIPEWSNETTRAKDKADIGAYLETVGITKAEFEAIDDHRYALVARDAAKWAALQKSKPAVLKKVTAAPKLLKPGTQQSRAAQDSIASQKDRERLKQTGRVRDAATVFKRLGIV